MVWTHLNGEKCTGRSHVAVFAVPCALIDVPTLSVAFIPQEQRNARYRTCESSPDFSVQIVTTVERCVRRLFHLDSHHNGCATTQFLSHTLRLGAHLLRISWTNTPTVERHFKFCVVACTVCGSSWSKFSVFVRLAFACERRGNSVFHHEFWTCLPAVRRRKTCHLCVEQRKYRPALLFHYVV